MFGHDAVEDELGDVEHQHRQARTDEARATVHGAGAAITEPVPLYLLESMGFENQTPEAFSEAIEEGTDVAPAVLNETVSLFDARAVSLLAYNDQTTSPETEEVRAAAENAGVAVVSLTETLPDGDSYISWMSANIDAIIDAVG